MFHIINHLYDGSFSYLYNSLKCNLNLYIQFTLYYITYPKPILQPVMIPSQFPSRFALCCVGYTPSVTLFPLCFAGHAFHSAFHNVFRNAFRYEKPRYVRDGGVLRCIRLVRYAMWLTVCGWRHVTDGVSWQRVGDAMSVKECGWRYVGDGALAYTLELELDSEVGKWIAHVSVLYNTVSTHATCRHGDDTPIKLYVTQLFLLRFHNAFRIKILSRANFRPDASATVALENCRLVSMYISDRKRRVQWKC